jgi:hypothetical protein
MMSLSCFHLYDFRCAIDTALASLEISPALEDPYKSAAIKLVRRSTFELASEETNTVQIDLTLSDDNYAATPKDLAKLAAVAEEETFDLDQLTNKYIKNY